MDENFDQKYRLEEMKTLRAEINIQLQEMYRLENFAIVALAAIASVVFIQDSPKISAIGIFVVCTPLPVVLYCFIRARPFASL